MEVLRVDPQRPDPGPIAAAARRLAAGGVVAFPTETVYGVGARGDLPDALERLRVLKSRPSEQAFTLHVAEAAGLPGDLEVSWTARRMMERFWPGPLTLILPRRGGGTIGTRVPAHPVARELLSRAGGPVLAASANPRGEPAPSTAADVARYFPSGIDVLLDGGRCVIGQSSSIVQVEGDRWELLREGLLTRALLARGAARRLLFVCTGNTCRSPLAGALFRAEAAKRLGVPIGELPYQGLVADTAGISALPLGGASQWARHIARERGADLSGHVPTPLTGEMLDRSDEIYAMSRHHLERIGHLSPRAAGRARLLSPGGEDMPDPIGGGEREYRACAELIDRGVSEILDRLSLEPRAVEVRKGGGA